VFLAKLSIEKPVMVTMGILVFIVFGILGFIGMPLNMMPDIKLPFVTVQTIYPGAGPREIENQITKKIEDAIATVSEIDYIESYSMDSFSLVMIKFNMGKNVDIANQEIKDKVDAIIRDFPTSSEKPSIQKYDIGAQPFMDVVLSGNMDGKALYEIADKQLKDRFSQIEGVAQVEMTGGNKRQINVTLSDRTVYENSLSMMQLMQILGAQNMDMPAGQFTNGSQEYSVRLKGEFQNLSEIQNTNIPTAFGTKKLYQLADISDGTEEVRQRAVYFNVPQMKQEDNIVRLSLVKSSDGNIVNIAKQIRRQLPEIEKELPQGVELRIVRDDSSFTKASVNDTMSNIWMGILLTGLILLLFLHDLRSTLIVALSMPISIISTFLFLKMSGFTINIMTLMGLSTSVGVLVTNSVVVVENIFRHKEMGNDRREAAYKGSSEIAVAVFASTLTNIVVFLPIASMTSMVGQFFKEFGLTVTYATIFSLITSFTITPMLASIILPEKQKISKFGAAFDAAFNRFTNSYTRLLSSVLTSKTRSSMLLIGMVALLVVSFAIVPMIGTELMPTMDQSALTVKIEMPQGTNLDQTAKTLDAVIKRIAKYKEVEHVISNLGTQGFIDKGTNLAAADVKLIDSKLRKRSTKDMIAILIKELADIPNARIIVTTTEGMGGDAPIAFFLQGQDNDRLEQLKPEVLKAISATPGLINLDTSTRSGKPELTIYPKRERMSEVGATVYDLALALRSSVEGMVATQYRDQGNEYDIKLSLSDESIDSPDKIKNLSIVIQGKSYVLSQLADVGFAPGVNKITHRDRYKSIQFTGGVAPGANLGDVTSGIKKSLDSVKLPAGYRITWGGDSQMMQETMVDMMRTFILAVLLTYMLLAAILESFAQPLLIMSTVPLSLIGVFFSLLFTGFTINIFSMMAMIMLVGIVVNNAILILDYVNIKRREGWTPHDALIEAGRLKLKPIIMSTLSIVIGMMPMALGIGSAGKEFRQSMGIVSIGGLMVSAVLTLFVIPAFYYITTRNIGIDKTQIVD
jgi:HAE1 family hydrophobic/amphiphilic exporter-1